MRGAAGADVPKRTVSGSTPNGPSAASCLLGCRAVQAHLMMSAVHGVHVRRDGIGVLWKPGIWAKAVVGVDCAGLLPVKMRWYLRLWLCSDFADSPIPNAVSWGMLAEHYCWTTLDGVDLATVAAVAAATVAGCARKAKKTWIQMQPLQSLRMRMTSRMRQRLPCPAKEPG